MSRFFPIILFLILFSSCRQKDLYWPQEESGVLKIIYEWPGKDSIDVKGMTACFFSLDPSGENRRFDIAGEKGGPVELPFGEYRLLTFNNDTPGIYYQNTGSAETYTVSLQTNNDIVSPIPALYSDFLPLVSFQPGELTYLTAPDSLPIEKTDSAKLVCRPVNITTTYLIEVHDVEDISAITSATFRLHGITDRIALAARKPSQSSVSLTDNFEINKEEGMLQRRFCSFMCVPSDEDILLEITYTRENHRYSKTFNVSEQVYSNLNPRSFVYILIDGRNFPVSGEAGGDVGSIAEVDGWTEVIIDYNTEMINR